jgi:long-chain-fatty-acid--CoA ligase ACSBG
MPKAVMISHDNCTWTANVVITALQIDHTDSMISYLPLSHIAAQMLDIHGPLFAGFPVYFAQPDALKGSLNVTLKEIRPTLFLGVPRVWEKIQEKMVEVGKKTTGLKKTIATWAKEKGLEGAYNEQRGESKPFGT